MSATAGTCAICLAELRPEDEAFLDQCWHHFHFACIRRWAECGVGQAATSRGSRQLSCPLCRQHFASAIYDCHDTAYRRHYFVQASAHRSRATNASTPSGSTSGSLPLTVQHRRRRAVYSSTLDANDRERLAGQRLTPQRAQRPEVKEFVGRELQALMLQQDVALVTQHLLGTLRNAAAVPHVPPTSAASAPTLSVPAAVGMRKAGGTAQPALAPNPAPPARSQRSRWASSHNSSVTAGVPLPQVVARVQAAAAPFLFEHAERFAWEVAAFAASASPSLTAYDWQTLQLDAASAASAGAEARRQLQEHQQQAARGADTSMRRAGGDDSDREGGWHGRSRSSSISSSGSEGVRRRQSGEVQRSDSEGYLELLLLQGRGKSGSQHVAIPQTQQQTAREQLPQQGSEAGNTREGSEGLGGRSASSPSARGRRQSNSRSRSASRKSSSQPSSNSSGSMSPKHHRQHRKRWRRRMREQSRSCSSRKQEEEEEEEEEGQLNRQGANGRADNADAASSPRTNRREGSDGLESPSAQLAQHRQQALAALQRHRQGKLEGHT